MDPMRELRWSVRADGASNRSVAGKAAWICALAIATVIVASMSDDVGPLAWQIVAVYLQRLGIVMAIVFGAYAVLFALDSRTRVLEGTRSHRLILSITFAAAVVLAIASLWLVSG